jgi:hypothetical protein
MEQPEIEQLMGVNFPWVESHERDWENVHDGQAPKLEAIAGLLRRYIDGPEVLIEVLNESDLVAVKSLSDAPRFIGENVLKGRIHITDRKLTGFVVVQPIGVATGWRA